MTAQPEAPQAPNQNPSNPTNPTNPPEKENQIQQEEATPLPILTLDEYQKRAKTTAIYPKRGQRHPNGINYTVLGLLGESGELANDWKKAIRDGGDMTMIREKMRYEIGDCLWYVALLADELGMTLEQVAYANIDKLSDRRKRGTLRGSGDAR